LQAHGERGWGRSFFFLCSTTLVRLVEQGVDGVRSFPAGRHLPQVTRPVGFFRFAGGPLHPTFELFIRKSGVDVRKARQADDLGTADVSVGERAEVAVFL
jgi:hypothetical protein